MKNYGKIVPVLLAVMIGGAWFSVISTARQENGTYTTYLQEARSKAEVKVTKYALMDYQSAIAENKSPEIFKEVADYLKENETSGDVIDWCEIFYEEYPDNPMAIEYLLNAYLTEDDYKSCFDILEVTEKRGVISEEIQQIYSEIKYAYEFDFNNYEDVGAFGNNLCPFKSDGLWGYINRYGEQKIGNKFQEVSCFTSDGFAAVKDIDGNTFYIDGEGDKAAASKDKYSSFGNYVSGVTSGVLEDGSVNILDGNLQPVKTGYQFVSTFQNGRALAKSDGKWAIIDEQGNKLINTDYTDVVLDEKAIAMRCERAFLSTGNGYFLADQNGKQISDQTYDAARVFGPDGYAAVCKGNEWFFIDQDGKPLSDKTYDDARSFNNGFAAVKVGDKWGFVDSSEEIVIDPQFYDARDFTEKGSCFVKQGENWQLLKLYRLNRRD